VPSKPPSTTSVGTLTTRDGGGSHAPGGRYHIDNNISGGRSSRRPFATEATGIPPIYFAFSHISDTFAPPPISPGPPREGSSSTTSTVGRRRELHALRLVKVEEARLFWSVFDEIIYDAALCNRWLCLCFARALWVLYVCCTCALLVLCLCFARALLVLYLCFASMRYQHALLACFASIALLACFTNALLMLHWRSTTEQAVSITTGSPS
jgi:hypothetical protein